MGNPIKEMFLKWYAEGGYDVGFSLGQAHRITATLNKFDGLGITSRETAMNRKIVGKPCEKCGCTTYLSSKPFGAFHNSQWLCDQCAAPFFKA